MRRLREADVILGFRADVAPEALDRSLQALIAVRLQAHARTSIGSFTDRFGALPGVMNVLLGGSNDFMIHVAAASADNLRNLLCAV